MKRDNQKNIRSNSSVAEEVRALIELNGERIWRLSDFEDMPFTAVAQAFSRLYRQGVIQRLGRGLYYHPRETAFGLSKPNTSQLRTLPLHRKGVFPAGNAAANFLGFSTQNASKIEISTNGSSLPRLIIGNETVVHTRRPESWRELSYLDAAILEFLRGHGEYSELSQEKTVDKLLQYFFKPGQFERLLVVAISEPPRVRAMLGAIGQEIGYFDEQLSALRRSLNPLSRFDFGNLILLKYAKNWQAKDRKII